ncbi:MAG TPA: cytochrome c oxidase subunit II [Terriglobales bacterium]|jgi:cytochrome c oxidase subunit 2|nr:cytochrome c oxidase subunit II [Terriglobales bacterium]
MFPNFPIWPVRAAISASNLDALFIFLLLVTGTVTIMIFILVTVFALRYRHDLVDKATPILGSTALETTWSLVPFGIFLIFFVWGAVLYFQERTAPRNAMEIYVVAKQWMWKLQHVDGQREINELHVPVDRDVKLIMTSQDVIHSFFVPAFRLKQDVLPGRYTTLWFHAIRPGTYHLFCAEYCGTQHSGMIGRIVVMNPAAYEVWLSGGGGEGSLASTGQKLFQQLGCGSCHRSDTQGRGPNLVGVFGKPVLLDDGRTVTADENYVRESVLNPGAKIVAGFKNIMPSFQGVVNEEQLLSLVAYVKSLQGSQPGGLVSNRPAVPRAPAQPRVK